jgi:hypothetical protein
MCDDMHIYIFLQLMAVSERKRGKNNEKKTNFTSDLFKFHKVFFLYFMLEHFIAILLFSLNVF